MNFHVIQTEIFTAILGVMLIIMELILPRHKKTAAGCVSVLGLILIFIVNLFTDLNDAKTFFAGLYTNDAFTLFFKQVFLIGAVLTALMTIGYKRVRENDGEFFPMIVFTLLGMMVMASANDLITLYIGLELMTIAFVIMTSMDRESKKASEAGLKYIVLSAASSGILLYGLSILYGMSGSVTFEAIFEYLRKGVPGPLAIMAVIFIIAGFGFKISAVPFHMWSPDVYEGAPTPVTAFLAVGSKAAGFAVLIRILLKVLPAAHEETAAIVIALSCLTMLVGNLSAIPQKNIKRMLAYSSIAHAGYVLLGIVAFTKPGVEAMMFYLLLYVFANTGAFAAVIAVSNQTGSNEIGDFSGMWKRSPFISSVLLLSLLSLAGIPPAAGFIGKFYLFTGVMRQGYLWLAFLALTTSVIAVYYYIIVIRVMLVGEVKDHTPLNIPVSLKIVMWVSAAATLIMGVYPGPVTDWTGYIASLFMR